MKIGNFLQNGVELFFKPKVVCQNRAITVLKLTYKAWALYKPFVKYYITYYVLATSNSDITLDGVAEWVERRLSMWKVGGVEFQPSQISDLKIDTCHYVIGMQEHASIL